MCKFRKLDSGVQVPSVAPMYYVAYSFGCTTPVRVKALKNVDEYIEFGARIIFDFNGYIDRISEEEYNEYVQSRAKG